MGGMEFDAPPPMTELLEVYRIDAQPWSRANFVTTLSGHVTGPDGVSGSINSSADAAVFAALRTLADVVVIGAGTARSEGYRRLTSPSAGLTHRRAAGRSEHPTLAVVTGSGRLPEELLQSRTDGGDLLVLHTAQTPAQARTALVNRLGTESVLNVGDDRVDPRRSRSALAHRGLTSILVEGGPSLFTDWIGAGAIDELCLTLRPLLLTGSGPRITEPARSGQDHGHPQIVADGAPTSVLRIGVDVMFRYRLR